LITREQSCGDKKKIKLTGRRSSESSSDIAHVGNDRLDSVSLSLNLGEEDGHPRGTRKRRAPVSFPFHDARTIEGKKEGRRR